MFTYNSDLLKQYIRRIILDLLIVPFAFCLAWVIRFDGHVPIDEWQTLTRRMLPIAFIYIATNAAFGVYRRLWAYASFRDIILLSEAVGLGTLILVVVNFALDYYYHYRLSTSGLILGGLLTLILSTIAKYRRQLIAIFFSSRPRPAGSDHPERVLIVGVNETAQQLATQIYLGKSKVNYELVGFVDDDPNGKGMNINGVEILGAPDQIRTLVRDKQIDVIIIARRPSDREERWRLISMCRETPAQIKVLPDITEVIDGHYEDPLTLRDVNIDDILGRAPATVNAESCRRIVADKVVLVTGAAGSIGSELCRQISRFSPARLLILDNNESALYDLMVDLEREPNHPPIRMILADVTDSTKIKRLFENERPQLVFHAAAYKHVPMLEVYPEEAIRVNVLGTMILSEYAAQYDVEQFVFISTDKAVNPSSAMGASKRISEIWLAALNRIAANTAYMTVRFGNVIGSRGSVVPIFRRQIEWGGPVTVTDPDMTRYFMSIPEAVSLVLHAATLSKDGDVYMLEMGEQVSILNLAQRIIRLKGLRVGSDIQIKYTGIRPGEKLHEELAYGNEVRQPTSHPQIHRLHNRQPIPDLVSLLGYLAVLTEAAQHPSINGRLRPALLAAAQEDWDLCLNLITDIDLLKIYQSPKLLAAQNKDVARR